MFAHFISHSTRKKKTNGVLWDGDLYLDFGCMHNNNRKGNQNETICKPKNHALKLKKNVKLCGTSTVEMRFLAENIRNVKMK